MHYKGSQSLGWYDCTEDEGLQLVHQSLCMSLHIVIPAGNEHSKEQTSEDEDDLVQQLNMVQGCRHTLNVVAPCSCMHMLALIENSSQCLATAAHCCKAACCSELSLRHDLLCLCALWLLKHQM